MPTTVTRLLDRDEAVSQRGSVASAWLQPLRYWHLFSLDAPTVAVTWFAAFWVASGVPWHMSVRWHALEAEALGIAVWLLYAMDRLLDASINDVGSLEERHRFHLRHRRAFLSVGAVLLPVLAWRVVHLDVSVRATWLALGVPMAAYALAVHLFRLRRIPKEASVAAMFALATALPALHTVAAGQRVGFGVSGLFFAGVCWLNCTAINKWESVDCSTGLTTWLWPLSFGLSGVGVVVGLLLHAPMLSLLACALSVCLLCVLDGLRRRLDTTSLRALADAALLTPLIVGIPALLLPLAR